MSAQLFTRRLAAVAAVALVAALTGADSPTLKDEDPLTVESEWKGKFSQMGTHPHSSFPPELEATLTVTRRDGDEIDVEMRETMLGMDITFLCRGRLTRNADRSLALEFKSHTVKGNPNAGFYLLDVPYTAKISGDTIKGTWKYVDKAEGIDLGGEFALTRE